MLKTQKIAFIQSIIYHKRVCTKSAYHWFLALYIISLTRPGPVQSG